MYWYIADPHYSQVLYLQIRLLAEICKPIIDSRSAFAVIYQHAQNGEIFESPDEQEHVPSYRR